MARELTRGMVSSPQGAAVAAAVRARRNYITENELAAWAAITERLLLIERAARAYARRRTAAGLLELRRALARRPRP
jgi:hypothetical protein